MPHDASLIATVAIAFVLASIFGYLADRVRLPALVGYVVAGIFIGPFTPGFVADAGLAGQLAEMGVILLMFGVGLHFSASDLLAVKSVAIPGPIIEICAMTLLGLGLTQLWGWPFGHGIVFGLCVSVASTVVLLKALEERNLVQSPMGRVAVGWLIVEDLAMVLALVLLPAFAPMMGGHVPGGDAAHGAASDGPLALALLITLAKLGGFVLIAALVGPRVVPWLLMTVARTGSRELFTLAVLAIALGIAFGSAAAFGVSFALGAFFAGVIMGESQLSHRAAANSLPLQDAFSVLFFVSIGMLFDPMIVVEKPVMVFGVLALIMLGKSLVAFTVVLLLGYPLSLALGMASSLAQIGEFSFILAGLGVTHGLLSGEGQDLVLAGALLSIALNPIAFAAMGWLGKWFQQALPPDFQRYGKLRLRTLVDELERIRALTEAKEHEQERKISEFVEKFPLFSAVDKEDQEELLLLFTPKAISPGERIIRAGERGDSMFFIAAGSVEVSVGASPIVLRAGSFVGEMALLTGAPRTADVTAVDFCRLLVLSRRDFNQFMSRHPQVRAAVDALAEERRAMNLAAATPRETPDPRAETGTGISDH